MNKWGGEEETERPGFNSQLAAEAWQIGDNSRACGVTKAVRIAYRSPMCRQQPRGAHPMSAIEKYTPIAHEPIAH